MKAQLVTTFILVISFSFGQLLSQARGEFYDPYQYELKNYKGKSEIGDPRSYYKDYSLPRPYEKPALLSPKNVQRPVNPLMMLPGAGGLTNSNLNTSQRSPLNPMTGGLNLSTNPEGETPEDSKKKKLDRLKELEDAPPYKETNERRQEIIFLMTFPFAFVFTTGLVFLIGNSIGDRNLYRTTPGLAVMFIGGSTLSYLNVLADQKQLLEKEHKENLSIYTNTKNQYHIQFVLGQTKF